MWPRSRWVPACHEHPQSTLLSLTLRGAQGLGRHGLGKRGQAWVCLMSEWGLSPPPNPAPEVLRGPEPVSLFSHAP